MIAPATAVENQRILDVFEKQKRRSLLLRREPASERKKRIKAFEEFLLKNNDRIGEAIYLDFQKPKTESDVSELYPVVTEIRQVLANLNRWAAPQKIDAPLT